MPDDLSLEELNLLDEAMRTGYGSPTPEEKPNAHIFLNKVANSKDTTKTGNLTEIEIGVTKYALRTYKHLALVCKDLVDDDIWANYFKEKGEILTATSLSKKGFLTNLAVIQRRQTELIEPEPRKENKGWFKSKSKSNEVAVPLA